MKGSEVSFELSMYTEMQFQSKKKHKLHLFHDGKVLKWKEMIHLIPSLQV